VVVTDDLVTALLPLLSRSLQAGFNVFDVMHHGTHEKQISNVFRWLLEAEGTHNLGDAFQRIFIDEVNQGLVGVEPFMPGPYVVRQEVNTSEAGDVEDIADLVLESDVAVLVVENYFTSDGHGHNYCRYLKYGLRDGRRGAVVLLCRDEDSSAQTEGWENASVVAYGRLVDRMRDEVDRDRHYKPRHPEAYSFIEQMHRKFAGGTRRMEDRDVLDFVTTMCATGQASRYQEQSQDLAAKKFAADLAEQAIERFAEGRELLQRIKGRLKNFSDHVLRNQLNATMGDGSVSRVSATYAGIYQWTVNLDVADDGESSGNASLQLKFGPSAWFANEQDPYWKRTVDRGVADYSHLFLTHPKFGEVRQSVVTLQEVLDGITPDDRRLHDEILQLLRRSD
jgi:PD-(D/E)XK nuclease superfamily